MPFRCVDEINQGLDERNERRVSSENIEELNHFEPIISLNFPECLANIPNF